MDGTALNLLKRLQAAETQLAERQDALTFQEARVDACKRQLAEAGTLCKEREQALVERKAALEAKRAEIGKHRESLTDLRRSLDSANTGEERDSLQSTIDREEVALDSLHTSVGRLEAGVRHLEKDATTSQPQLDTLCERLGQAKDGLKKAENLYKKTLHGLRTTRGVCARRVDSEVLDLFDHVAADHEGEALAPLVEFNPRRNQYCCGGCHMQVSLDTADRVRTGILVTRCDVCGRILYADTDGCWP